MSERMEKAVTVFFYVAGWSLALVWGDLLFQAFFGLRGAL
jgi:hypothetical protein